MNIFNYFKKKGIDTLDPAFYRKIKEWESWYKGNVSSDKTLAGAAGQAGHASPFDRNSGSVLPCLHGCHLSLFCG